MFVSKALYIGTFIPFNVISTALYRKPFVSKELYIGTFIPLSVIFTALYRKQYVSNRLCTKSYCYKKSRII